VSKSGVVIGLWREIKNVYSAEILTNNQLEWLSDIISQDYLRIRNDSESLELNVAGNIFKSSFLTIYEKTKSMDLFTKIQTSKSI